MKNSMMRLFKDIVGISLLGFALFLPFASYQFLHEKYPILPELPTEREAREFGEKTEVDPNYDPLWDPNFINQNYPAGTIAHFFGSKSAEHTEKLTIAFNHRQRLESYPEYSEKVLKYKLLSIGPSSLISILICLFALNVMGFNLIEKIRKIASDARYKINIIFNYFFNNLSLKNRKIDKKQFVYLVWCSLFGVIFSIFDNGLNLGYFFEFVFGFLIALTVIWTIKLYRS
jgi:hypothetical protein